MSEPLSIKDYFEMAVSWYKQNDRQDIPSTPNQFGRWDLSEYPYDAFFEADRTFGDLTDDGDTIKDITMNAVPFFAGVYLGFNTVELARIIQHHEISSENFSHIYTAHRENICFTNSSGNKSYLLDVIIEAHKAFYFLNIKCNAKIPESLECIASMHIDRPEYWPTNLISMHAQCAKNGQHEKNPFHDFGFMPLIINSDSHLPNNNHHDFLRRSGLLNKSAIRKEGGDISLWEELIYEAPGNDACLDIINSVNTLTNKEEIELVKLAIKSLSLNWYNGIGYSDNTLYSQLEKTIGNAYIREEFDSVIFKINTTIDEGDEEYFEDYMKDRPDLYAKVLDNKESLLSMACNEILEMHPGDIGRAHINIFNILSKMDLPNQKIEGFDPNYFLRHLQAAVKTMISPETIDQSPRYWVEDDCKNGFRSAVQLIAMSFDLDAKKLQDFDSSFQLLMVAGGMPASMFPKMTDEHKGKALEIELGL